MIQLGISLCDENGRYIPNLCCWQFNFKFSTKDTCAPDSLELLKNSGIKFDQLESRGIEWNDFAEVFMTSGIVLNPRVNWISFHSGFDFAYLVRVLTANELPKTDAQFFELLHIFCPVIYDIKYMIKSCEPLKGGLQRIAETLEVHRIGPQHQAGSDALLTAATFFKMRADFFDSWIDDSKYRGVIFGLNCPPYTGPLPTPAAPADAEALAFTPEPLPAASQLLGANGLFSNLGSAAVLAGLVGDANPLLGLTTSAADEEEAQRIRQQPLGGLGGLSAFSALSLSSLAAEAAQAGEGQADAGDAQTGPDAASSSADLSATDALRGALPASASAAAMGMGLGLGLGLGLGGLGSANVSSASASAAALASASAAAASTSPKTSSATSAATSSAVGSMGPPPPRTPHSKRIKDKEAKEAKEAKDKEQH
jgi:CCR4-NOT transcription complex subunit 7/8